METGEWSEVLVLFPERIRLTGGIWQRIEGKMAREMPDLLSMTEDEKREGFDRLSNVIAERMPYRSPEELERAMRGDRSNCEFGISNWGFD